MMVINDYFGARYYASNLSIWLSVDPLSDMYTSTSPYMYVLGNPIKYIDPNGMNHDVYITGKDAVKATEDLNAGTSLIITRNSKTGKLSATGEAVTKDDKKLLNAINDNSVDVNVDADNNAKNTFGGSFMGNSFKKETSTFSVVNEDSKMQEEVQNEVTRDFVSAEQRVNPSQLEYLEKTFETKRGAGMLHEVTESYKGALISRKWGIEAQPALSSSPNYGIYLKAHNKASPQPGEGKVTHRIVRGYHFWLNNKNNK